MRAYSPDLRQRVLRAVDEGKPRAEIIDTFQVARATIKRYLKRRRETGNIAPRAIPGRTPKKGAALRAGVPELLEAHPDATLEEYCRLWESKHGVKVSTSSMSRAIRAIGWTRKKRHWQPASETRRREPFGASR